MNIFKIGTFNVQNLSSPNIELYNSFQYSQEEYEKKIQWASNQLIAINADIVGFQEIFDQKALMEMIRMSNIYQKSSLCCATNSPNRPFVACLSRFPIEDYEIIEKFPDEAILKFEEESKNSQMFLFNKFSRPVLRVKICIPKSFTMLSEDIFVQVYVVHLKSKRPIFTSDCKDMNEPVEIAKATARSLIIRSAESVALRSILMKSLRNTDNPVVVLGDINDSERAITSQIVTGLPPEKRAPFLVKKQKWDTLLYHVKDIQARLSYQDFYYTHIFNGHYEALDHIMVSQEFVMENHSSLGRVVYVHLFNDHLIDSTLSPTSTEKWKSDHGQVVATIELKRENTKEF